MRIFAVRDFQLGDRETCLSVPKCPAIGVLLVCLNWRLSVDELRGIVEDAKPVAIVFGAEFEPAGLALAEAFGIDRRMVLGAARYAASLAAASGAASSLVSFASVTVPSQSCSGSRRSYSASAGKKSPAPAPARCRAGAGYRAPC